MTKSWLLGVFVVLAAVLVSAIAVAQPSSSEPLPWPGIVAKTGQTISSAPGDDGDYQAGFSVTPRFTVNGDGTVTDNLTRLIWLQDANSLASNWATALSSANGLADGACDLTDGSLPGDWRLPNVKELPILVDRLPVSPH